MIESCVTVMPFVYANVCDTVALQETMTHIIHWDSVYKLTLMMTFVLCTVLGQFLWY